MTDVMDSEAVPETTRADWQSDQEVRWCPGCGDYSILTALQLLLPDLGVRREKNSIYFWHRLRGSVPLLYEHLWYAQHPWSCPRYSYWVGFSET